MKILNLFIKCFIYLIFFIAFCNCSNKNNSLPIDLLYIESKSNFSLSDSAFSKIKIRLANVTLNSIEDSIKYQIIKGKIFMRVDEYEKSINEYKLSINYLKKAPNDSLCLSTYLGISRPYYQLGKFSDALFFLFESEKLAQKNKSTNSLGICYNDIAQIMQTKGDLETAKQYLNKSIPLNKYNEYNYYNSQLTLANVFGMSNQLDSALAIDNDNLKKLFRKNKPQYETYFYNNKANCFLYSNQIDSAEIYFKKCLALDLKANNNKQIADCYASLINVYSISGDTANLKKIASIAINYSNSINYFFGKQLIYESLTEFYNKTKNYKLALSYKDSAFVNYKKELNENSENKIAQLKVQFDFDQKEQQIQNNKREIILQRILLSTIIGIIIILILYFKNYYKISKQREHDELVKLELKQKEIANKSIFETEQKERTRIARDLHDSIGQMLAYIKMQSNQIENSPLTKAIDQTILEVRNISHELMPPELNFGLQKALDSLICESKLKVNINFDNEFTAFNFTDVFSITLYRIMQELVNNTIKHANATEIFFNVNKNGTLITIQFLTNGNEISDEKLNNSSGIGWQNIKARLLLLNGNIQINNSDNKKGFFLMIHLPYATN